MQPNPSQDDQPDTPSASPDAAQRRCPLSRRGAAAGDADRAPSGHEHQAAPDPREEVVGRGAGGTAGCPPAMRPQVAEDPAISFDPSEWEREGETSITPSQKTTTGGEDWLSINFWVDFPEFDELKKTLDQAQAAARE